MILFELYAHNVIRAQLFHFIITRVIRCVVVSFIAAFKNLLSNLQAEQLYL